MNPNPRKILIASGNSLFGKGLMGLIAQRWKKDPPEIRLSRQMAETLEMMESWQPDLVIVDYDDTTIDRGEFLRSFVSGDQPMQVMLVSLQTSGAVVVYDRRTLTPAQAEDWLSVPWVSPEEPDVSKEQRSSTMRHFVIAGILIVLVATIVYLLLNTIGILPAPASVEAGPIDQLFTAHFLAIAVLFALITVLMVYSMIVFRQRKGDNTPGRNIKGSTRLEIFWTLIPLVVVLYFSYLGSATLDRTNAQAPDALEVDVLGGQWYWSFTYPDWDITTNELWLPVDRPVLFRLRSADVIHSFWVPEWRVKQDLLPGENFVRELRVTPTEEGQFQLLCAEMCGVRHAYMVSPVYVVSQDEFNTWVNEQTQAIDLDPAARGQKWAQDAGCFSCHSIDGSDSIGPTWLGLYDSERELVSGETFEVDDDYLFTAIVDPDVHVAEGFRPGVMPQDYETRLTEEQIEDIIEFIESLE